MFEVPWTTSNIRGRGGMKHYAGVDVSLKETSVRILDETGTIGREINVTSHPQTQQHRFAFARNGPATASAAFRQALAAAGVGADTPATVLCDGDAWLWRLQRAALPGATIVLDWWHAAVRFEHALQAARGLGVGTADAHLVRDATAVLERAKWCLWHGRWTGCRRKLA